MSLSFSADSDYIEKTNKYISKFDFNGELKVIYDALSLLKKNKEIAANEHFDGDDFTFINCNNFDEFKDKIANNEVESILFITKLVTEYGFDENDNTLKIAANQCLDWIAINIDFEQDKEAGLQLLLKKQADFLQELNEADQDIISVGVATGIARHQMLPRWFALVEPTQSVRHICIDTGYSDAFPGKRAGAIAKAKQNKMENISISIRDMYFPLNTLFGKTGISEIFYNEIKAIFQEKLNKNKLIIMGDHHAGVYLDPLIARLYNELHDKGLMILDVSGNVYYHGAPVDLGRHYEKIVKLYGGKYTDIGVPVKFFKKMFPELVTANDHVPIVCTKENEAPVALKPMFSKCNSKKIDKPRLKF